MAELHITIKDVEGIIGEVDVQCSGDTVIAKKPTSAQRVAQKLMKRAESILREIPF